MSKDQNPQNKNDYVSALEVMAEVSEAVTHDLGSKVVSEASNITFSSAVSHPTHPEHRPYMKLGGAAHSLERPKRKHDLDVTDIVPGLRVVAYNDKLTDKQKFAKHEVVLSDPYIMKTESGTAMYIDVRQVRNHATDEIPLESEESKRSIPLSAWGITPNINGTYSTTKYAEPYSAMPEKIR